MVRLGLRPRFLRQAEKELTKAVGALERGVAQMASCADPTVWLRAGIRGDPFAEAHRALAHARNALLDLKPPAPRS